MTLGRKLAGLFLALALVAVQWAGQVHALSHATYDLAAAVAAGIGGDQPVPLDHPSDQCVAFHALDGAAMVAPLPLLDGSPPLELPFIFSVAIRAADPLPFSSRAPPVLPLVV